MGNEETMSRMHKDPGGLAITIAPNAAPIPISIPFFLPFFTDSFATKAIIKPGVIAKLN